MKKFLIPGAILLCLAVFGTVLSYGLAQNSAETAKSQEETTEADSRPAYTWTTNIFGEPAASEPATTELITEAAEEVTTTTVIKTEGSSVIRGVEGATTTNPDYPPKVTWTTAPPPPPTAPSGLEYVPGSIPLGVNDYYETYRPYRFAYYHIPWYVINLVFDCDNDESYIGYKKWVGEMNYVVSPSYISNPDEMAVLKFIRAFNIPREDFAKAVEIGIRDGSFDNSDEFAEALNTDVIYTFDNAIISRYYRYE